VLVGLLPITGQEPEVADVNGAVVSEVAVEPTLARLLPSPGEQAEVATEILQSLEQLREP
jgi:hypothetical protein